VQRKLPRNLIVGLLAWAAVFGGLDGWLDYRHADWLARHPITVNMLSGLLGFPFATLVVLVGFEWYTKRVADSEAEQIGAAWADSVKGASRELQDFLTPIALDELKARGLSELRALRQLESSKDTATWARVSALQWAVTLKNLGQYDAASKDRLDAAYKTTASGRLYDSTRRLAGVLGTPQLVAPCPATTPIAAVVSRSGLVTDSSWVRRSHQPLRMESGLKSASAGSATTSRKILRGGGRERSRQMIRQPPIPSTA